MTRAGGSDDFAIRGSLEDMGPGFGEVAWEKERFSEVEDPSCMRRQRLVRIAKASSMGKDKVTIRLLT